MIKLSIATLIWAFSFSLIGQYIIGSMDIYIAILIRFSIAALIFLPFFDFSLLKERLALKVLLIGAIQIGGMYIFYFNSFKYLSVAEVALFTVVTPIYISIFGDLSNGKFSIKSFISVTLAIMGAAIIKWNKVDSIYITGVVYIQLANLFFATGQVLYKKYIGKDVKGFKDRSIFALFYIGALLPIAPLVILKSNFSKLPSTETHYVVLLWLGLMASGLGYYFWNTGAKKVTYNQLAVMNNAVIPCAILVNLVVWKTSVDWKSFLLGSFLVIVAVVLSQLKSFFGTRC
jgi:carboxylate/amino acid/amine transporter